MNKMTVFQKWIVVVLLLICITLLKAIAPLANLFYYDLYSNIDVIKTWINLGIMDTLIVAYILLIGFLISIMKSNLKKN